MEAQLEIDDLIHDMDVQIALIRKLMVHRFVRVRSNRVIYRVLEVRIAYGKAVLFGHGRGKHGKTRIAPLADVDIINTGFAR